MDQSTAEYFFVPFLLFAVTVIVFITPIFILFPPIPVERSDALQQTHTKLGLGAASNLKDQYSSTHQPKPNQPGRIQSLWVYPVKSCRGIELARSRVIHTGLEHDRLFTFAQRRDDDALDGAWEFATQRQLPRLANVKVDLWLPDQTKTSRQLGKLSDPFIVVRFPWQDAGIAGLVQRVVAKISRGMSGVPEKEFMIPVDFPSEQAIKDNGYTFASVKIWKEVTTALNMGVEVPPQLKAYLGAKGRFTLFRMDPGQQREVFRCAPTVDDVGYQPKVDFHDAYPIHMLSLTSTQDLTSKIEKDSDIQELDARRFRSNIIISGVEAYDEETWKAIKFANPDGEGTAFAVSCRTVRCKMPNINPDNGLRHRSEPDHALRTYRNVDEGAPKYGCLGMQMCPVFPNARRSKALESFVEVGMEIDVQQRGAHLYIDQ